MYIFSGYLKHQIQYIDNFCYVLTYDLLKFPYFPDEDLEVLQTTIASGRLDDSGLSSSQPHLYHPTASHHPQVHPPAEITTAEALEFNSSDESDRIAEMHGTCSVLCSSVIYQCSLYCIGYVVYYILQDQLFDI